MSASFSRRAAIFLSSSFLVLISPPIFGERTAGEKPRLVLAANQNSVENSERFSCSDTIHGNIVLPEKTVGFHSLEGVWIMPDGTKREHSKTAIEFPPPGRQTAYIWLRFDDKSGGLLDGLRDGGATEADTDLNGEWQVQVLWDGKPLVQSKFTVKC